jgi:predicted ribosomally synthesized peptide with nif11-like leader
MSIKNVINLIEAVDSSHGLREKLNSCIGPKEFSYYLESNGYNFSGEEFEDAVRMLHLRCQEQEEAELVLEKALWLRFLIQTNEY